MTSSTAYLYTLGNHEGANRLDIMEKYCNISAHIDAPGNSDARNQAYHYAPSGAPIISAHHF